jgi:hypothetical protein
MDISLLTKKKSYKPSSKAVQNYFFIRNRGLLFKQIKGLAANLK